MTSLLQTGLNGHLPAPPEKRFLISARPSGRSEAASNRPEGLQRFCLTHPAPSHTLHIMTSLLQTGLNGHLPAPPEKRFLISAEWDRQIAVNLKSVFLCARRAIPLMKRHGGGSIINTSSVQALATTGRITAYAAAKGGIIAMSRDLARDFGKDGIRINTICPGCIYSPMLDRSFDSPEARDRALAELAEGIPLGRIGDPDDFAHLAMFLASSLSSYIIGQWIVLDGGLMCRLPLT